MSVVYLVVFLLLGVSSEGFEARWTFLENNNLQSNNNHLISLVQNEFIPIFNCNNLNYELTDLSAACQLDLLAVFSTILQCNHTEMPQDFKEKVVETMLDASGKKPAGLKQGGLTYWGDNLECRTIEYAVPYKNETLQGGYSRIFYNAELKDASDPKNCDIEKSTLIGWDLCSPKTCANQDDLMKLLKKFPLIDANGSALTHSPICYVTTLDSTVVEPTYQTWIVVILMSVVIIMALIATFIDYYDNFDVKHGFKASRLYKLFLCFSLYQNLSLIFHVGQTTKQDQIMSFNCIRFLSISWVVMGHIIAAYINPHLLNNYLQLFSMVRYIQSQIIWNALLAVDTFFFMSGVLLAFLWFKKLNRNPKILASKKAWILFYVHRIIRLSPPYFFALSFYIWVFPSLQWNMPIFMNSNIQPNPCLKYWWTNFLYINNFVYIRDQCYVASWYLAADMQMFIFTPIILIPLVINPTYGILTSATLLAVSTLANMVMVYVNHYGSATYITGWRDPEMIHTDEYPRLMYQAAWIRCQIYIMGILVGYLLQRLKHMKINKTLNVVMWILAICLMLSALFGLYNQMNGQEIPLFWRAMYSGLSRPAWGLGLSWITVSCYYGYGGLINKLMSLKIWIPLSRLAYSVYLIHMIVLNFILGLSQYPIVYSGFLHTLGTMVIPIVIISFFLAVLWSAFFEIPFFKMEAILIRSQMSKDESDEGAIIIHENA